MEEAKEVLELLNGLQTYDVGIKANSIINQVKNKLAKYVDLWVVYSITTPHYNTSGPSLVVKDSSWYTEEEASNRVKFKRENYSDEYGVGKEPWLYYYVKEDK